MTATVTARHRRAERRPAAAPVARVTSRPRRIVARVAQVLTSLLLVLAFAALLLMTVAPRVFHYRTATMLTGSMVPYINPGDIIVDTEEPTTAIRVGQVITYHIPVEDHRVESHRVIWIGHDTDGTLLVRTKGDANNGPDPWTARMTDPTVWQVRGVVPVVGKVIRWLRAPLASLVLSRILPVVLVGWLLASIWLPGGERGTGGDPTDTTTEGSARKQDRHRRAAVRRRTDAQCAAVGGDDPVTGRQPQAGAGDLRP